MVKTGLDKFVEESGKYRKRSIALIANQTSVVHDLEYSWNVLKREGIVIKRIFSPEHGIFSTEQDQVAVEHQPDIGIEIVSLYGDSDSSIVPDEEFLKDIDLVIFDIQDVGSRYYTYLNMIPFFMKAIEHTGIEMMILDRPNPLGGLRVEGPLLDVEFSSFVGIYPVTVRHGLTPAELAFLYKDMRKIDIELSVKRMEGWRRSMLYDETGLQWIPPSPNMPTTDTAMVYAGSCLFEGINVSEGRGTTTPFQIMGAPFIQSDSLADRLNRYDLPGVFFRPVYFKPCFNEYSEEMIGGIFIHVTDSVEFHSFLTGVAVVKTIYDLYPDRVVFKKGVYEFNTAHPAFDLLTGSSVIREMIISGASLDEIFSLWQKDEKEFLEIKREYHLYGD